MTVLEKLKQNRNEILKAEILSYLTLWEKVKDTSNINKSNAITVLDNWETILKSKNIYFKLDDKQKNFDI